MSARRWLLDLSPLRDSRAFRYAYAARTATVLVTGMLMVANSIEVYDLSGSSLAVALLNAAMAVPMAVGLLAGGVLADRVDRRTLMLRARLAYVPGIVIFLLNALLPQPMLWPMYLAALMCGAATGISMPAMMAVIPALVGRERLAAAAALSGLSLQLGGIIGPALAGVLLAGPGLVVCYAIVLAGVLLTPLLLSALPPLPPSGPKRGAGPSAWAEALGWLRGNVMLRRLLWVDFAAMVLATPLALLPQWGSQVLAAGPEATGLLYAAPAAGALVAGLGSGWTRQVARPGLVVIGAVLLWGLAVLSLALGSHLAWALGSLAVMGAADTVSKILRAALVQRHTPDALLGRMSSVWMMQSTLGPALGNLQIGLVARLWSPPAALLLGGAACLVAVGAIAAASPALRRTTLHHSSEERA
ncbi:MAG: enterobactin transporter EntS [Pigmentiphaga sp.]|nr:enterobactin transporter EntS [Pigmentiphaga sp.]